MVLPVAERRKGNFQMKKASTEYLLAEAIDLIDTLFNEKIKDKDTYKSTYEFIRKKLDICDSELDELGIDLDYLKK